MSNLISILPEPTSTQERVSDVLAAASALLSGLALLVAVAAAF
jgi:hypothetical protein